VTSMKLLLAAVALAALIHEGTSIHCYSCTSDPSWPFPYDPNCANFDYSDTNFIQEWEDDDSVPSVCYTVVYSDDTIGKSVERNGVQGMIIDDGDCFVVEQHTICYCTGDLCN
ncbi:unnamed protein product, partial [Meganyctiphanes norvegica]